MPTTLITSKQPDTDICVQQSVILKDPLDVLIYLLGCLFPQPTWRWEDVKYRVPSLTPMILKRSLNRVVASGLADKVVLADSTIGYRFRAHSTALPDGSPEAVDHVALAAKERRAHGRKGAGVLEAAVGPARVRKWTPLEVLVALDAATGMALLDQQVYETGMLASRDVWRWNDLCNQNPEHLGGLPMYVIKGAIGRLIKAGMAERVRLEPEKNDDGRTVRGSVGYRFLYPSSEPKRTYKDPTWDDEKGGGISGAGYMIGDRSI